MADSSSVEAEPISMIRSWDLVIGLKRIPTNAVNPDSQVATNGPLGPTQVLTIVSKMPRPKRVAAVVMRAWAMPQSV